MPIVIVNQMGRSQVGSPSMSPSKSHPKRSSKTARPPSSPRPPWYLAQPWRCVSLTKVLQPSIFKNHQLKWPHGVESILYTCITTVYSHLSLAFRSTFKKRGSFSLAVRQRFFKEPFFNGRWVSTVANCLIPGATLVSCNPLCVS